MSSSPFPVDFVDETSGATFPKRLRFNDLFLGWGQHFCKKEFGRTLSPAGEGGRCGRSLLPRRGLCPGGDGGVGKGAQRGRPRCTPGGGFCPPRPANVPGNRQDRPHRQGGVRGDRPHSPLTALPVLTVFSAVRGGSALGGRQGEVRRGKSLKGVSTSHTAWKQKLLCLCQEV